MTETFDTILKYVIYLGLGFGGLFLVLLLLSTAEMPYHRKRRKRDRGDHMPRGLPGKDARERKDRSRAV